jgi:IS30 family transposase
VPGRRLSIEEREELSRGLVAKESLRSIAGRLGRPASTLSREVARNGGVARYRAARAHRAAHARARRPKEHKLARHRDLARAVEGGLETRWSPEQIANRLRLEHPAEPYWWVSHEAIYQSLYVQGRGGLRAELVEALRSGRTCRRKKGPNPGRGTRGRIVDPVLISERPPEVEDRAVPGHWEGDLVLGRSGRSQVATLVERTTRFVVLVHLPGDRKAETVRDAMQRKIATLPEAMLRSITWDQGKEMATHASFTVDTGIQVYFCEPHHPWQRGTNENTNGLLRQYLPRSLDLSTLSEEQLDAIADELNGRPRETLGWRKPSERFAELVATIS